MIVKIAHRGPATISLCVRFPELVTKQVDVIDLWHNFFMLLVPRDIYQRKSRVRRDSCEFPARHQFICNNRCQRLIILTILVTIKINQFPIQADIFCCLQIWIIKNFTMYPQPHPRMAGKAAKVWRRQTTEAYLRWWWVPRCGPPGLPLPCVPRNKPGLCPPNVILSTSQPWSSWGWRVSVYISHFCRDPTPSW